MMFGLQAYTGKWILKFDPNQPISSKPQQLISKEEICVSKPQETSIPHVSLMKEIWD